MIDSEELLGENGHLRVTTADRYADISAMAAGSRAARRSSREGQEDFIDNEEGGEGGGECDSTICIERYGAMMVFWGGGVLVVSET